MNKKIILLSPLLTLIFLTNCKGNSNITVNEDEWKNAIENITHFNKRDTLNYIATGSIKGTNMAQSYGFGRDFELTSLECNDKIEKANFTVKWYETEETVNDIKYSEYISNNIYLSYSNKYSYTMSYYANSYMFIPMFDIYKYYSDFAFNSSLNKYECHDTYHGKSYYVSVKFNKDKKIEELSCDYSFLNSETSTDSTLIGTLKFEYGNSKLNKSTFPAEWEDKLNNSTARFSSASLDKKSIYISNNGSIIIDKINVDTYSKVTCNESYVFRRQSDSDIKIYQDGVLLSNSDYYLTDIDKEIDFRTIVFRNSIKDKYIEIIFNSQFGTSLDKYTISLA